MRRSIRVAQYRNLTSATTEFEYDLLYKRVTRGGEVRYALCLPRVRVLDTIIGFHDGELGGHYGAQKTYDTLRDRYQWEGMYGDITNYVRTCKACQLMKIDTHAQAGLYQPLEPPKEAWAHLAIDTVGPINPPTRLGHAHLLVVCDRLTKWAWAAPLPDIQTRTIIKALKQFFFTYAIPKTILSDRGTSLMSAEAEDFYKEFGVRHLLTSGYAPQCNGQVESLNKALILGLATSGYQEGDVWREDWDLALPGVVHSYNLSVHAASGYSPIELALGIPPRRPIDQHLGREDVQTGAPSVSHHFEQLELKRQRARSNIARSQARNKRRVDQHRREVAYQTGDRVLLFNPVRKLQPWGKFRPRYTGPLRIVKRHGAVNYLVASRHHPKPKLVHVRRLKPFYTRAGLEEQEATTEGDTDHSEAEDEATVLESSATEEYFGPEVEREVLGKRPVRPPRHLEDYTW